MSNEESIQLDDVSSNCSPRKIIKDDFGRYEIFLLIVTQLGYIPVAAVMLITTFMEPSPQWCDAIRQPNGTWDLNPNKEFYSLSVEHGMACNKDANKTTAEIASLLMFGALIGSFICGFLSDKLGRKPIYLGCLVMISLGHGLLVFSDHFSWWTIKGILSVMGFVCGGYMVTNFVILTEAFELARSRLLVVCLNGWSISMAFTGAIASYALYWFIYHLIFAGFALCLAIISFVFCFESCRWLSASGMQQKGKKIALKINSMNRKRHIEENDVDNFKWYQILGFSAPTNTEERKTWKTLYKSTRLFKSTAVMFYSFMASSIISFGFYFSIDILPGNRYWNMTMMGIFKFISGATPFWLNKYFTKRVIAISSVAISCLSIILILPIQCFDIQHLQWLVAVFSVIISSAIDPTWKINHLYSAELFPTSVRSMARGVSNVGGRLGSVIAPVIVYLRAYGLVIPNIVFSVILIIQLIVFVAFLPDDNDRDPNEMSDE